MLLPSPPLPPCLPIMHERRNDRPSRYILVHLQWGQVTASLILSSRENKVKVLYFSFQCWLPVEWHCVEISFTGVTQIRLEIWKVLAEIRIHSKVQFKLHGADCKETRPCSIDFIKELSSEFLTIW